MAFPQLEGADRPLILHGEGVVGVLGVAEGDFGVDLQAGAGGVAGVGVLVRLLPGSTNGILCWSRIRRPAVIDFLVPGPPLPGASEVGVLRG
jgi:hypothetical protein